jgi:hypothetical protein
LLACYRYCFGDGPNPVPFEKEDMMKDDDVKNEVVKLYVPPAVKADSRSSSSRSVSPVKKQEIEDYHRYLVSNLVSF